MSATGIRRGGRHPSYPKLYPESYQNNNPVSVVIQFARIPFQRVLYKGTEIDRLGSYSPTSIICGTRLYAVLEAKT